jgi:hypothetical protein
MSWMRPSDHIDITRRQFFPHLRLPIAVVLSKRGSGRGRCHISSRAFRYAARHDTSR